jgi:hypothetical protein
MLARQRTAVGSSHDFGTWAQQTRRETKPNGISRPSGTRQSFGALPTRSLEEGTNVA